MKKDPHVQLMLRFQKGEENAFKQLFEIYKRPLLNFIYRYCQDFRVAEELSQEVFLRVYKTASTYKPVAKFSTWLYRIATNICLNEVRTGRYKYEVQPGSTWGGSEIDEIEARGEHASTTHTEESMVEQELQNSVKESISKLPEKQRIALLFSIYDQLSYREIGERMGCSEGAVKSIVHRAKLAIKTTIQLTKEQ